MDTFMRESIEEAESAPGAREFMQSHGIEVVNLHLPECRQMMHGYIAKNRTLWNLFLGELNLDLLSASGK